MSGYRATRRIAVLISTFVLGALLPVGAAGASKGADAERLLAAGTGQSFTSTVGGATRAQQAEERCFTDPVDDVVTLEGGGGGDPIAEPRADLVEHCAAVDQPNDSVTLRARVSQPTDPREDINWSGSVLGWFIDTDNDGEGDFFASLALDSNDPETLVGTVQDRRAEPNETACAADAAYTAPFLVLDFALSCIESGGGIAVSPGLIYDQRVGDPNGVAVFDKAPNGAEFEEPLPEVVRIDGDGADNTDTALALSQATFADGELATTGGEVLLGRDDVFADSLASGGAQGALTAPLLLTPSDQLDPAVSAELERLGAERVTLLGGEVALSNDVEAELIASGYETRRLEGPTRLETAIAIAEAVLPDATTAVLARAFGTPGGDQTQAFADSLAGGAYAAEREVPVLLTPTEALSDTTEQHLTASSVDTVVVLGGTAAVSTNVENELTALGITVRRLEGDNRFGTAVAVSQDLGYATASDAGRVVLAEGQDENAWVPGFTAALYTAQNDGAFVLSNGAAIPTETATYIEGATVPLTCLPLVEDAACDEAARLIESSATG